jgi:hypothetical protein
MAETRRLGMSERVRKARAVRSEPTGSELPERWSAPRKAELVLQGAAVPPQSRLPPHEGEGWKRVFLEHGTRDLKIRGEPDGRELKLARATIGDLMMRFEPAEDSASKGFTDERKRCRA